MRLTLGNKETRQGLKGRKKLIPDISFVMRNMVLLEERNELLLKRMLLVMFLLVRNVFGNSGNVGFADAKHTISGLPRKFGMALTVNPFTGIGLDDTHNFGNRMRGTNTNEHMNMIGHAVDDERRATHFADDAAQVSEYVIADVQHEERQSLFGRENQMNNDVTAGLGHFLSPFQGLVVLLLYPG